MLSRWTRGPASSIGIQEEHEAHALAETITAKRDRLLASLTLIAGIAAIVALPFALRAGAEFFMPVTAALVIAIALVPLLEWFERRGVPSQARRPACASSSSCCSRCSRSARSSFRRATGSRRCPTKITEGPRRARAGASTSTRTSTGSSTGRRRRSRSRRRSSRATVAIETPNSMLGLLDHLGAAPADPAVLRAAGDLLLPRRLDRDAQEDDRQPRQLRRRADHRAGDPAGGRRDLDLSRHDHAHQHRPRRADRAGPVVARDAVADDVGRHRRGRSTTSPISGPIVCGAAAVRSAG